MTIDKRIYKRASYATCTDYQPVELLEYDNQYYIEDCNAQSMIEDLLIEIDKLNEKIDRLEEDIKENYKPIPQSEQYDISERDFI